MASLRRIPGRLVWIACFTDCDGKRYQRSTGTRDEKLARRIADEFEESARKLRTSTQVRRVVFELHERITGESIRDTTVRQYLERYLKAREPELVLSTHKKYCKTAELFLTHLEGKANKPIILVAKAEITSFRDSIASRLKPQTANGHLKIVKVFFRQAKRDGVILDNIAEDVAGLKVRREPQDERQPFSHGQLTTILQRADGELKGIILFGYYTGSRLKDICLLRWNCFSSELSTLNYRTGKRKILPIVAPLRDWLQSLPPPTTSNDPIFPIASKRVEKSGNSAWVSNQFTKLLAQVGIREPFTHQSRGIGKSSPRRVHQYTFHSIRHTMTSHLKDAGVSEAITMEIVGHDTEEMSRHYTKLDPQTLRKTLEALPMFSQEKKPDSLVGNDVESIQLAGTPQ